MKEQERLEEAISKATGRPFRVKTLRSLGGGCINDAYRVADGQRAFFVKSNQRSFREAFEMEAEALRELAATKTLRVPEVVAIAQGNDHSFLVLEHIETRTSRSGDWAALGRQLAELHGIEQPHFGWRRDNLIGATPQPNPPANDWIDFFRSHRLEHQMRLCQSKGFTLRGGERLLPSLELFFPDKQPRPSLLHGDLWSGNVGFASDGQPFVFDPGSYYGDREADLAFTEFFGGFGAPFYDAYREALPVDSGYATRKTLYNLYHCLNHVYLFGASYADQAQRMADELLAQT